MTVMVSFPLKKSSVCIDSMEGLCVAHLLALSRAFVDKEFTEGYLVRIKEQEQTIKTLQAEVAGNVPLISYHESSSFISISLTIPYTFIVHRCI
jgi:hypothetical protein